MSIRNKLILMLAVPLTALALIGALGFRTQSSTAQDATQALEDDAVVQSLNTAIKAIGAERLAFVDGLQGLELAELRREVDDSLDLVIGLADTAERSDVVAGTVRDAQTNMEEARFSREPRDAVADMNRATAVLREVRDVLRVDYPTAESFSEATAIDLAVDIADRQDSIWLEYIASDEISEDLINRLRVETAATDLLREQIVEIAPDSHTSSLNASLNSSSDNDISRISSSAVNRFENNGSLPIDDASSLDIVTASHQDWYGHALQLQSDVSENLSASASDAGERQNLFALLATLGSLILFGLIYTIYRSVVRPLDELLVGAEDVASNRLPSAVAQLRTMGSSDEGISLEPLPKENDDELGSLVNAFNDVQLTAFDLAVEQARSRRNIAEMFVNLGRRNQKLLQRMLSVISELEHDEKDAEKLEQLFQLDHMTTRMRRNAESLLVVAGTKTPRQWTRPVPAADVVRSALAEVQDYHRIDILSLADAPMAGNAVADVTHLLAELLENSLQFSEPDTRVTVSSRWLNSNYRIVITDHGFGMTPEELVDNNELIANPPPPDQAPTRFLGLFVVGHLAHRHGIEVVLTDATIGGTDARITIPASLMTDTRTPEAEPELPARGEDELDLGLDTDLDAELAKLTAETELRDVTAELGLPSRTDEPEIIADEFAATDQETDTPLVDGPIAEPTADPFTSSLPGLTVPDNAAGLVDSGETFIDFDEIPPAPTFDSVPKLEDPEPAPELPDLPVRGEVAPPAPEAPAPQAPELPDLPVRGEVAPPAPEAPELPDLPVRGEVAPPAPEAPELPDLPVRGEVAPLAPAAPAPLPPAPAAPAPAAPAPVAPAPVEPAIMPIRGEAAPAPMAPTPVVAEPAPAALMGLPLREPKAALGDVTPLLPIGAEAASTDTAEPEQDISTAATSVGSIFSSFQAGIKRGENTGN